MAKAKVATPKDIELSRWCIEMAMRWPLVHVPQTYGGQALSGVQAYQQGTPARDMDADVIGRAAKIEQWVKAAR